jgi:hypothetical protein
VFASLPSSRLHSAFRQSVMRRSIGAIVLVMVGLYQAESTVGAENADAKSSRPNVIVIYADDKDSTSIVMVQQPREFACFPLQFVQKQIGCDYGRCSAIHGN